HRVALPAHLRASARVEACRLDDCGIRLAGEMQRVPSQRIAIRCDMRRAWAVTRLAGDPDLSNVGLGRQWLGVVRSVRRGKPAVAVRGMAIDADVVPATNFRDGPVGGRTQEHRTAREPQSLVEQIDTRKLAEQSTVTRAIPVHLLLVRARD